MAGVLLIDARAPSFDHGTALVTVEDARRADAPAAAIASARLPGLSHRNGMEERIPFALDCPDPAAGIRWSVRASIDLPGGGLHSAERVHAGDDQPVRLRVEMAGGGAP